MLNIEVNDRNSLYLAAKKATGLDGEALVQAAMEVGLKRLAEQAKAQPTKVTKKSKPVTAATAAQLSQKTYRQIKAKGGKLTVPAWAKKAAVSEAELWGA